MITNQPNTDQPNTDQPDNAQSSSVLERRLRWIETYATVVTCEYQFARMNTLLMGIQTDEKFRIVFEYYANGQTCTGEFRSPVAIPQNQRFAIRYNPLRPQENDRSRNSASVGSLSLIAFGVAGSIILSLLWLAMLRGC